MKKFAVGLCTFGEDIEVVIVESKDDLNSLCDAVVKKYNWEVRENDIVPFLTLDEGIDFFLQGEVNISKPVLI